MTNKNETPNERESIRILRECIELQIRKSQDYQNEASSVTQAMHYRRGIATIHDMIEQKILRARSLIEAFEAAGTSPNNEALEDTYKDIVNYSSFAAAWLRGLLPGQDMTRDMLNRPRPDVVPAVKAGPGIAAGVLSTPGR